MDKPEKIKKNRHLRWLRLDNAAKIYPAARREDWSNVFRVSASLTEPVDVSVLEQALEIMVERFPSIAARLRKGMFWYYLQQLEHPPAIREEYSYPLVKMSKAEVRRCALRVIVYRNRIALEFFHSLNDGNGAMVFLKNLLAEYLERKYNISVPFEQGIVDRHQPPAEEELEDSFQKYAGSRHASRQSDTAWHLTGSPEPDGFRHITCFQLPVEKSLEKAHEYGISLTAFLCAVMMEALQRLQAEKIPDRRWRPPIKVFLPVNLRRLFPSKTLRNFILYTIPEIQPRLGSYTFPEICKVVHHCMGSEVTAKQMSMMIATNLSSERILAVRILPLFIKNLVMKAVFNSVGEKKSCLSFSNLGAVKLPENMAPYVTRLDFILGVQATAPYNCGIVSWKDTVYINFIRDTRESELEYRFFQVLQEHGIPVLVESNGGNDTCTV